MYLCKGNAEVANRRRNDFVIVFSGSEGKSLKIYMY